MIERLAKATESGGINKDRVDRPAGTSPTGAFASGTVGMLHAHSAAYFFVKGQGRWISPDTLGVMQTPGDWSTPTNHGFAVSKSSKNPDLAFALIKHMTSTKWATRFSKIRRVLTANIEARQGQRHANVQAEDPLAYAVLQTQLEHKTDKTGNWPRCCQRRTDQGCILAGIPECRARTQGRQDRPRRRRARGDPRAAPLVRDNAKWRPVTGSATPSRSRIGRRAGLLRRKGSSQ